MSSKNKNKFLPETDSIIGTVDPMAVVSGQAEPPKAVELKDLALGYCKVKRGNETKWVVVSVALDGQTGQTSGIVDFLEELDTEADAVDRFKINVAERLMLINRR